MTGATAPIERAMHLAGFERRATSTTNPDVL
jgi:hypothetical protein